MKTLRIILVMAGVVILASLLYHCGGTKAALTIDVTKPITLEYKGEKGRAFSYKSELSLNHVYVSPEDNAEKMTDIIANYTCQYRYVEDEPSGDLAYHIILGDYTLTRSVMNARPEVKPFLRLKGRRVSFSLDKLGEISNKKELDVIRLEADMPVNPVDDIQFNFIRFPDRPVKQGDTWSATYKPQLTSLQLQGEVDITDTYTLEGAEYKKDIECIKIRIDRKFTYTGNINLPGLEYEINGEGEEDIKYWFDNARGIVIAIERQGREKVVSGVPEMPMAKVDQVFSTRLKFEIQE